MMKWAALAAIHRWWENRYDLRCIGLLNGFETFALGKTVQPTKLLWMGVVRIEDARWRTIAASPNNLQAPDEPFDFPKSL